jgi:protein-tyrosine phosphatase
VRRAKLTGWGIYRAALSHGSLLQRLIELPAGEAVAAARGRHFELGHTGCVQEDDPKVLSIVFVCSGNICRSPMAEKVFAATLEKEGLADRVRVSSAGIGAWHAGEPADPRAAEVLLRHGYLTDHVARQVNYDQLEADLLVAAGPDHVAALRRVLGAEASQRVRLLRSFDPQAPDNAEVPDPYYGGDRGFDDVLTMIRAAMPGLLAWVKERLRSR